MFINFDFSRAWYWYVYIRDESFITSWGGRLHFHVMYKIFYDPPNPTGKKISTPPRFMTKIFVTPPIVNTPAPKHNPLFLL